MSLYDQKLVIREGDINSSSSMCFLIFVTTVRCRFPSSAFACRQRLFLVDHRTLAVVVITNRVSSYRVVSWGML
jgi:hypothetical protein